MGKKIDFILKEALKKASPEEKDVKFMEGELKKFLEKLKNEIRKQKVDVEIFVGGSFAKNTLIRKEFYDADIFLRYSQVYSDKNLTKMTGDLLKSFKETSLIHGSRDYYKLKISKNFFLEIVPVLKIKKPKEARNITDLSYSHVNYVKNKLKSKKILDEIKIAKLFFQANGIYGAESYIKGFSGYAIELIMIHYKTFENMIKKISNSKEEKIIIDIENNYKNKNQILRDINESKLESPIILIDPTYQYRNALAALSQENFNILKKISKEFLKNPSIKFFEIQKVDLKKLKENAEKNNFEFILIEIETSKQEGDIAGTKLLKFHNHFLKETNKYFEIKNKKFEYGGKKSAKIVLIVKKRKELVHKGPPVKDLKNSAKFKKEHKNTFSKKGVIYAKEKINFNLKKFMEVWKAKNKIKIQDMYIKKMKIVD